MPTDKELIHADLTASWAEWMQPKNSDNKPSQGANWRRDNPGEWTKLQAYRNGGVRPNLVTHTGRQMVEETDAWLASKPDVVDPPPPPPPPPPTSATKMGVYAWGQNPDGVREFETLIGHPVDIAEDFLAGDSWAGIEGPGWLLNPWKGTPWTLVLGVPLFPSGGSLAAGAKGDYDQHFKTLAQNLVVAGKGDSILRLGWEFGGSWYLWHPKNKTDADNFKAYWRRIVAAMRPVAPGIRFDWNGVWGRQDVDPALCYPGDDVVDFIGCDIYDQSWVNGFENETNRWNDATKTPNWSIQWFADFAKQHGKPLSVPEWGLANRDDGHGGGDAPGFITHMADWLAANNCGYHVYFNVDASDGAHELGNFPKALAVFKGRF